MRYLILIACVLLASCSMFYESPKNVEIDPGIASLGACVYGPAASIATATRIGDAVVTAKHWARANNCLKAELPQVLSDPSDDITVLSVGEPGICKDAVDGESIVYLGYPGTSKAGLPLNLEELALETDVGLVKAKAVDATADGEPLLDVDAGSSRWVRPGYSGGPVVSARDGRIVGIINAINGEGMTFFTPISRVCRLIEEARVEQLRIR